MSTVAISAAEETYLGLLVLCLLGLVQRGMRGGLRARKGVHGLLVVGIFLRDGFVGRGLLLREVAARRLAVSSDKGLPHHRLEEAKKPRASEKKAAPSAAW
jgi:hypothetical protein